VCVGGGGWKGRRQYTEFSTTAYKSHRGCARGHAHTRTYTDCTGRSRDPRKVKPTRTPLHTQPATTDPHRTPPPGKAQKSGVGGNGGDGPCVLATGHSDVMAAVEGRTFSSGHPMGVRVVLVILQRRECSVPDQRFAGSSVAKGQGRLHCGWVRGERTSKEVGWRGWGVLVRKRRARKATLDLRQLDMLNCLPHRGLQPAHQRNVGEQKGVTQGRGAVT
jgi:hypothetical protein